MIEWQPDELENIYHVPVPINGQINLAHCCEKEYRQTLSKLLKFRLMGYFVPAEDIEIVKVAARINWDDRG